MSTTPETQTLTEHLARLAADAEDVATMLAVHHRDGGDIQPQALAKSERLNTSLHEVIHALTHHEHLAMDADDVWGALTQKHVTRDDGTVS